MAGPENSAGKLARLRDHIARIETDHGGGMPGRAALGHGEADAVLQAGLRRAQCMRCSRRGGIARRRQGSSQVLRSVSARIGRCSGCGRILPRGIRCAVDAWMAGDRPRPRLLVMVHTPDVESALRTAADALACDALGAVVMEIWGEARLLRSRRQPQADAGGAGLRRYRAAAAGGGKPAAFDGGDTVDRAPGALAARRGMAGVGRPHARNAACP